MRAAGILSAVALVLIGTSGRAGLPAPVKRAVDFEADVRPIFAAACYPCHGPQKQKSDFRLDRKAAALKGGDNGRAIVPGKSADSPLIQRVASSSKDERMPPTGPSLSAAQVAILRTWIDQGAKWPDVANVSDKPHWAYLPLTRPPVPTAGTSPAARNPIDAFVLAKLAEKGFAPSPPADRRVWIRRVTFDLIGMPPTRDEVRDFLADQSPNAHEKVVDRLLTSPHYGERWARHWMDVAHFAESHGNDQDRPRPNAWPYRDYLIRSLNDDKPYSRFVAEQVAGDVLYPDDSWATAALGFLAAGPWDESSLRDIVADTVDNRIAQVLDRDDMLTTVMTTFVGATVDCARCHNHKFDPISQEDYYALQAVFAGVGRAERPFDTDSAVHARRRELLARKTALAVATDRDLLTTEAQARAARWEQAANGRRGVWRVLTPVSFTATNGSTATRQPDGSLLYGGTAPERDTYFITVKPDSPVTAVRLEVMADPSLPRQGPGRQDNGNLHLSEFRLLFWPGFGSAPVPVPIKQATADFNQDGWTISLALDGNLKTAWGIYPEVGRTHSAVFELTRPMTVGRGAALTAVLAQHHGGRHLIGRPRLSATAAEKPSEVQPIPDAVATILDVPQDKRTAKQQADLARFVLRAEIDEKLASLPPPPMVYAAAHDFKPEGSFKPSPKPRPVHVLRRGDILSPMAAAAQPGTFACVPGLPTRFSVPNPDDEGARRAALARWLVDANNVLTWRSIVNRVWHYHFGRGIVDTPNDFGRMGGTPSHPELLDWLAVEFRDGGGSLKSLHKLIVLSDTYAQSSQNNDTFAKIDGDNRLLWHMNRTRLDSESVRDAVLRINGKLDVKMGGPSVKQFIQTPGIHVTPNVDYASFNVDDPANYRRSIYRFHFRTLPDPFLEALDQPDASQQTPVRAESVTPLQALAMLNDKFMVRQCEHLAGRLAREARAPDEQVRRLFDLALGRPATSREVELLTAHAAKFGMVNVCRVVLNSNEFMFVP